MLLHTHVLRLVSLSNSQIYSLCSNTPVDGYEINKLCCEQITSQVDILWKIYSLNREGQVTLKEIRLYPRFFNYVLATPVDCGNNTCFNCSSYLSICFCLPKNASSTSISCTLNALLWLNNKNTLYILHFFRNFSK